MHPAALGMAREHNTEVDMIPADKIENRRLPIRIYTMRAAPRAAAAETGYKESSRTSICRRVIVQQSADSFCEEAQKGHSCEKHVHRRNKKDLAARRGWIKDRVQKNMKGVRQLCKWQGNRRRRRGRDARTTFRRGRFKTSRHGPRRCVRVPTDPSEG